MPFAYLFTFLKGIWGANQNIPRRRSSWHLVQVWNPWTCMALFAHQYMQLLSLLQYRLHFFSGLWNIGCIAQTTYSPLFILFLFSRYIVWTSENFPKGGRDLGNLLERCMTTFKDQERYKNDERYAKVWLRYVSLYIDKNVIIKIRN